MLLTLKSVIQQIKVFFSPGIHPSLKLLLDSVFFLLDLADLLLALPLHALGQVHL